jgi:hypothetical protein
LDRFHESANLQSLHPVARSEHVMILAANFSFGDEEDDDDDDEDDDEDED